MINISKLITHFFFLFVVLSFTFAQDASVNNILNKEQTYVDVPKTSVRFMPPAHFIYMEQNAGYLHIGTSSSIQVLEITGTAYTMITPGLTKDYFKSQGVELKSQEDVITKSGQKGVIYTVSFFVDNVEFERLMFFTGNYHNTIWINANYPVAVKEMLNAVLKESILTAQFKE